MKHGAAHLQETENYIENLIANLKESHGKQLRQDCTQIRRFIAASDKDYLRITVHRIKEIVQA